MKVRLIEQAANPEEVHEVVISQPEFLIGRGAECDLRMRATSISRHHCLIRTTPEEALVIDLGSSNGTFLNEHQVRSPTALHSGDRLRIGDRTYLVDLGDQQGDLPIPSGTESFATTMKMKSPLKPPDETK
jgi:pSer/pThr/pTyr-binding forkhead associated (FHA) protein